VTTNYFRVLITASADSKANAGTIPAKPGTIASLQFSLLAAQPYALTSDELLFEVYVQRNGIASSDRDRERAAFSARPNPCLRTSPLVKVFGWGLHHDSAGKVAVLGVETEAYRALCADPDTTCVPGMRSRRA
jgi:Family of unknown function (DUF6157)